MDLKWLSRSENDAEHSRHLAMCVLIFHPSFPELNLEKCLSLALLHDLPELYAGDCPPRTDTSEKQAKEHEAIQKLLSWMSIDNRDQFDQLFSEYESRSTKEARFVYELDKVIPIITSYLCEGTHLKRNQVTIDEAVKRNREKVSSEFWFNEILEYYFNLSKENWYWY